MKRPGLRVEHRAGYYSARDFAHTGRQDRERQLQDQLAAPVSATDLPVVVSAGWFRLAPDRDYVPLSVAVPGRALTSSPPRDTLDILGLVRDEQGRPVGRTARDARYRRRIRRTGLGSRRLLYQSGLDPSAGRFQVKVVVRENARRGDGLVRDRCVRAGPAPGAGQGQLRDAEYANPAGRGSTTIEQSARS